MILKLLQLFCSAQLLYGNREFPQNSTVHMQLQYYGERNLSTWEAALKVVLGGLQMKSGLH